jgi:hypothetical protein
MVGAVSGGGLGDLGIRYGYQRFMPEMMLAVVVVLIALVQTVQTGRQHTYSDFFDEIPDAGGLFVLRPSDAAHQILRPKLVEFAAATSNLRDRCRAWLGPPQVIESIRQL